MARVDSDDDVCEFCYKREADSICDECSQPLCMECTKTTELGVLCPACVRDHVEARHDRR